LADSSVGRWLARALGLPALRRSIRRSVAGGAMMVAAAVMFLAGVGLLIAALTVWIARGLGTIAALAIVGGVLVLIAAVVLLVKRARTPMRSDASAPDAIAGAQGSPLAAAAAAIIAELLREKALLPIGVAVAGLLAALALRQKAPNDPTRSK
jgi:hypothetical protein